jgi:membrane-associated protease RseP (regulator of RpoE activity)
LSEAERFLYRVAVSALDGHVLGDAHPSGHMPRVPLPLSATDCLARLREQRFETSEEMLTALASVGRGAAAVSRTKRAGHLALCVIPIILIVILGLISVSQAGHEIVGPDITELSPLLTQLELMERRGVPSTNPQYRALEVYVAGRYHDVISNPPIWSTSLRAQRTISGQQRTIALRIASTFPRPQNADVDQSVRVLGSLLDTVRSSAQNAHPYIGSISAGDAADRAGLKANDVIIAVDDQPIWFGSQLRNAITTHANQLIALSILRDGQPLVIRATPVRKANQPVALIGIEISNEDRPANSPVVIWRYAWLHAMVGLMFAGTLGILSALAARGSIVLRLTNIALVNTNGTLASRSRGALRAILCWSPVFGVFVAVFAGHSPLLTLTPPAAPVFGIIPSVPPIFTSVVPPIFFQNEPSIFFIRIATIAIAVAVLALAAICAVIRPERGLQDRLAGTWLVPR